MFLFSFMLNGRRIFPEDRNFNLPIFANIFTRVFWWTRKCRIGLKLHSRYNLCLVFALPCLADNITKFVFFALSQKISLCPEFISCHQGM